MKEENLHSYLTVTQLNSNFDHYYNMDLIVSFADRETEKIWEGEKSKILPSEIQQVARRKFKMINTAENINDLTIPPINRLKKLKATYQPFTALESMISGELYLNGKVITLKTHE